MPLGDTRASRSLSLDSDLAEEAAVGRGGGLNPTLSARMAQESTRRLPVHRRGGSPLRLTCLQQSVESYMRRTCDGFV